MSDWSLSQLLSSLHDDIQHRLATVRKTIQHPGSKGDASEDVWIEMLNIPHAGGVYPPKPLIPILGGMLTFESDWSPALGPSFVKALNAGTGDRQLDIGCVASHGHFFRDGATGAYNFATEDKAATAFLFKLISRLQFSGTVPMIDIEAYAEWLIK